MLGYAVSYMSQSETQVRFAKILCLPLSAVMASLAWVMRQPDLHVAVASLNFVLGFLAMGSEIGNFARTIIAIQFANCPLLT